MFQFIDNLKKTFQISPFSILVISFISLFISITEIIGLGFLQIFLLALLGNEFLDNSLLLKVSFFLNNLGISNDKLNIFKFVIIFFILKNFLQIFLNYVFFSYLKSKHNELLHKFAYVLLSKNYSEIISIKNTKFNQIFASYVSNFVKHILGTTLKIISESIFVILIIIYLLNIKFDMILLLLSILIIFLFFYNLLIKKYLTKNSKRINTSEEILKNYIYEYIKNFREIFIYKLKENYFKNFKLFSNNFTNYEKKYAIISSLSRNILEIFLILFIAIYFLLIVDINDTSKLSSIIIIIFGLVRLMPSINILNHCVAQMSQHSYAYKELNYFLRSKKISILKNYEDFVFNNKKNNKKENDITEIILNDLSFSYENNQIFKNLNLRFKLNQIILIKGISGSGKSTLIDLITGIQKQSSGKINFINKKKILKNYNNFGFVSQNPTLFSNTLKYNLTLKNNLSIDEEDKLLKLIKVLKLNITNKTDNILNYQIMEDGKNLSGGQLKKISLIRTYFHDPKIIFLDEITANLDKESRKSVLNFINKFKKNRFTFIVSHRPEKILNFDKTVDLNKKK